LVRETFEDLAIEKESCVFVSSKSELLDHCRKTDLTTVENTEKVLNAFLSFGLEPNGTMLQKALKKLICIRGDLAVSCR